ncbi:MAG: GtrA family protein [Prevotella sp.]|nr:GtrA family protein [Prevotella sp.]
MDKLIRKILSVFPEPIRNFYGRHESALLYVIVGGMTTVVSVAAQYVPAYMGLPTEANTTISWIFAVTFAFFANKVWVFKDKSNSGKDWISQAAAFYGARAATYFMELGFMSLTVRVLNRNEYVMKLIAQVFILVINYLFSKLVIFRKKTKGDGKDV